MPNSRIPLKRGPEKRFQRSVDHRLRSVQAVLAGKSAVEVARIYGDSPRSVASWVVRFREGGTEALHNQPRAGRPHKLAPEQLKQAEQFVSRARRQGESVSGAALASFIKERFSVSITRQHCRRILNRLEA